MFGEGTAPLIKRERGLGVDAIKESAVLGTVQVSSIRRRSGKPSTM